MAKSVALALEKLGVGIVKQVSKGLFEAGERIQVAAQISITEGSVSGKDHVPSEPGEPPNNDTGVLANNIETVSVAPLVVHVESKAPYAAALEDGYEIEAGTKRVRSFRDKIGPRASKQGPVLMEFGGSSIAARPYMAPAANAERKNANKIVQKRVGEAIRRARKG